jgi:dihydrofolate reductase
LQYVAITSLDGYIADEEGNFDWSEPNAELHQVFNDMDRAVGTQLYGRRLYEVMLWWETLPLDDETPEVIRDYAEVWRASDKVVYSATLDTVSSGRTRLEREFIPDRVREMVAASEADISIGGAALAGTALAAGLVDDIHQFISPVIIGGGTRFLPDGLRVDLQLASTETFDNGVVHLHYRNSAR